MDIPRSDVQWDMERVHVDQRIIEKILLQLPLLYEELF